MSDYCILQGDLLVLLACRSANYALVLDAESLLRPSIITDQSNMQETRVFEVKLNATKNGTLFSTVQSIRTKGGALSFTHTSAANNTASGYFSDNAGNQTIQKSYRLTKGSFLDFFMDSKAILTKVMDQSKGETIYFYTLARGETHESMGSYAGGLDNTVGFDSFRDVDDYYNLVIYASGITNNTVNLHSFRATPYVKSSQPGLLNNLTLTQTCADSIQVTESLIVLGCRRLKLITVLERKTLALIH